MIKRFTRFTRFNRLYSTIQIPTALTYDDVLLVPQKSTVTSRKNISLRTRFSRNIWLNNPIVSSNMDTVTEDLMAKAMAINGGIGILHRFLSVEEQVEHVKQVKRAEAFIITNPYTINENNTINELIVTSKERGVRSFLVTNRYNKLVGIITSRDTRFATINDTTRVTDLMTPIENLHVIRITDGIKDLNKDDVKDALQKYRLEKLPIVDQDNRIHGLITAKDFYNSIRNPYASHDSQNRLLVGAAIGVKNEDIDRALLLAEAGVDCIVLDIAHGHSTLALNTLKELRKRLPSRSGGPYGPEGPGGIDIVAGNVATGEGANELAHHGADAIKVGVGPGSICTTRIVTGCGVPQLSAIMDVSKALGDSGYNIPIIADGGIKTSGDITKALAAGAHTVMLGNMLAGTDESPGIIISKNGRKVKMIRGMAGISANLSNRERQRMKKDDIFDVVPEGVEAQVPYRGKVKDIIKQLCGGLASGISYNGANSIEEMQKNAKFIRITNYGKRESDSHDVEKI